MNNDTFHFPVLLDPVLRFLKEIYVKGNFIFVDSTLGEGGHSKAVLEKYDDLKLIGVEIDSQILFKAKQSLSMFEDRISYFNDWFDVFFSDYPFDRKPNFILVDLGISIFHYKCSKRGFSFLGDEYLDMRLNPSSGDISASEVLNTFNEDDIADLIYNLSDEHYSRKIAKAVVEYRKKQKIQTTKELQFIINKVYPCSMHNRINPSTKTFQALRIYVNDELSRLKRSLPLWIKNLDKGGILAIITFHSIEDRIVKKFFKNLCSNSYINISKKPIIPGFDEIKKNKSSRSAKLRAIKKIL